MLQNYIRLPHSLSLYKVPIYTINKRELGQQTQHYGSKTLIEYLN